MTVAVIQLEVSYSQIAVFLSDMENPFNNWTDQHIAQGFAWRSGSVSFGMIHEASTYRVEVVTEGQAYEPPPEAVRIIKVPFRVPPDVAIEVASISDAVPIIVPTGQHSLYCELWNEPLVRLEFCRQTEPDFEIVRADAAVSVSGALLLSAGPAL